MLGLVVVVSSATSCRSPAAMPPPPRPPPRPPAVSIAVTYREGANVFEILDNVSNWWPAKCDSEYRDYWKERFGISDDDERRFAAYKQIRKAHYPRPADAPERGADLFGPAKAVDRFAEAFYGAATVDAALATLAGLVTAEELATLKDFYTAYRPSYEPLLAESRPYSDIAAGMQSKLAEARVIAYLEKIARSYGVTALPPFTALYVWWPPVDGVSANNRDRYLLLKYNPTRHRSNAGSDFDVPVHEFAHYVSAHQSEERKLALSKTFLAGCDPTKRVPPVKILEEPLAVAHQKMFLALVDPQRFDVTAPWYHGDKWVDPFAKAIYPHVVQVHGSGRMIDDALMTTMASSCAELLAR